ncbi:MAG: hypothetical protein HY899_01945 [Deltaproteobacteria bacterium]|nr:hypothetical protein [Deltaproteobacteria bacterium]
MRIAMNVIGTVMLCSVLGCAAAGGYGADDYAVSGAVYGDIDETDFYRSLAADGQWSFSAGYGWAWRPAYVGPGWRPYTVGRWVWSDPYGWTWASYEPWGWAVYHYGRWFVDPFYGWMWVPGTVWAPAWVGWRICDDYIGWAPLPPGPYGYDYGSGSIGWSHWSFAAQRDFTSPRIDRNLLDRDQTERVFRRTRDVTRFEERDHEAVSRSIDRRTIERATGGRIEGTRIVNSGSPRAAAQERGGDLPLYRPRVRNKPDGPTPDRLGLAPAPERQPERRRPAEPATREDAAPAPGAFGRPEPRPEPDRRDVEPQPDREPRGYGPPSLRPERARDERPEPTPPPAGRRPGETRSPSAPDVSEEPRPRPQRDAPPSPQAPPSPRRAQPPYDTPGAMPPSGAPGVQTP